MTNYSRFARSFSRTRTSVWEEVRHFLDSLPTGSTVLEAGCGNGKNMKYRSDLHMVGVDICKELLEICEERNLNVMHGDIRDLPFEDGTFDYVICVAVIHHLETEKDRIQSFKELLRVSRKGVFITLWQSLEGSKLITQRPIVQAGEQDFLVPWGSDTYRYYHLCTEKEIDCLMLEICQHYSGLSTVIKLSNCNWNISISKN